MTPLQKADSQSGAMSKVIINNTQYDYNIVLINPEGRYFVFRPEAIKDLTIYDAINQYASRGYLVYDNSYDALERPTITTDSQNPEATTTNTKSYVFRGDARDILRIQITPLLNPNNPIPGGVKDTTKKFFTLNYEFVIYDVEDTCLEQPDSKLRKLYFHDTFQQVLMEKNVQFSTASIAPSAKQGSTDDKRSVKTGTAIKELLKSAFPDSEGFNIAFDNDFDLGGTDIFFTAPADYKADDCLKYLLERHVSTAANNYDLCFLKIGRWPRTWSLTSLRQMFDNAYIPSKKSDSGGPLYLERFLLGGAGDNPKPSSFEMTVTRSPEISIVFADTNTVENFTFLPPAGSHTQQEVVSKLVHAYRTSEKSFFIDSDENDFTNLQEAYVDNYVKNMKGANGRPVSNLVSNQIRAKRENIENVYTTIDASPEQRLSVGRSDTLKSAVFLNKALTFRVKGATYRQAGYFISLDRNNSLTDSSFDDKLLGLYLIVEVRHTFIGNDYYNDLICVKTYNYQQTGDQQGNYL